MGRHPHRLEEEAEQAPPPVDQDDAHGHDARGCASPPAEEKGAGRRGSREEDAPGEDEKVGKEQALGGRAGQER